MTASDCKTWTQCAISAVTKDLEFPDAAPVCIPAIIIPSICWGNKSNISSLDKYGKPSLKDGPCRSICNCNCMSAIGGKVLLIHQLSYIIYSQPKDQKCDYFNNIKTVLFNSNDYLWTYAIACHKLLLNFTRQGCWAHWIVWWLMIHRLIGIRSDTAMDK